MEPNYFEKWLRQGMKPVRPLTAEQAAKHHQNKAPYTIAFKDGESWTHFVEFGKKGTLEIGFLHPVGLTLKSYMYWEKEPGWYFWSQTVFHTYDPKSGNLLASETHGYMENGLVTISKRDHTTKATSTSTGTPFRDDSPFWEKYPDFGQYVHLLEKHPPSSVKV